MRYGRKKKRIYPLLSQSLKPLKCIYEVYRYAEFLVARACISIKEGLTFRDFTALFAVNWKFGKLYNDTGVMIRLIF